MTRLIFCAAKNKQYAQIATSLGITYGAQLPEDIYFAPGFVDQDWHNPVEDAYMKALETYRPALASVLDWERWDQLPEVLRWAETAARFVSEAVIIIPKVPGGIPSLPREIGGKPVRLGFSVQVKKPDSKWGGTGVPLREFDGWPVHLLGGSPQKQYELAHKGLRAVSADNNYIMGQAQGGRFYAPAVGVAHRARNKYFPLLKEAGLGHIRSEINAHAFRLSCINLKAMWRGASCGLRYAVEIDIPQIETIWRQNDRNLGRLRMPKVRESMGKLEVVVAEEFGRIVGFLIYHQRRDQRCTIYQIAVERSHQKQNIGAALLGSMPGTVQLKCTVDNPANGFYEHEGFKLIGTEPGRKRVLNVWERAA